MKKILANIKTKPEKVREQIAIIAAGGVTLLVVVVWAFSLENRFRSTDTVLETSNRTVAPEKPLTALFDSLGESFKNEREEMKANNPFRYDESTDYQAESETIVQPETQEASSTGSMQPSVMSVDTTTENDPSKDEIMQ